MTQPRPNKGVHALANGLHWLHAEIARCLERVRGALEIYLESDSDDPRPLLTAAEQVRQVAGSVSMVQCLGATMLAREMRAVLEAAIAGQLKEREKAFAALSVATLQLSDYIELLAGGEPDRAVVLEPIISELRVARGRPLMSEIDLFGAQMVPLVMATDACLMEAPQHTDGDSQALAQAELANYQRHFVDWFRSRQVPVALQAMNGAALRIAQSVSAAPLRRLWWNLTLLTESLLPADTTDLPVELKRLVGRSGVELQRLAQRGEGAAADTAAGVAIQVLYWLARASQRSARAQRLAEALHLSEVLPDEATLARARQHLHAPNAGALAQVRKELGRELQTVKDNIDLVVRTGGRAGTQPDQIAAHLRRIGDTLGMLGLDRLRQVLYNQATGVLALPPDAPQWLDVATTLVRVETALDEKLVRGARATTPSAALDTGGPGGRSSVAALAQEALVDSAQIESAMAAGVAQHSTAGLAGLGPRIQVLVASLRVGGLGAAADQLAVIGRYIDAGGAARAIGDPAATDRLAEAFASVEIYLEGLRDGLPQPEALMARVAACVAPLAKELETRTTEPPAQIAVAAAASASPVAPSPAPSMAIPPAPRAAAASEPVDPEILDIFVEEAGEVVSGLKRDLPRLERDLQDKDALTEVRRAFHTLKGSGRMVGASGIGEFAWAIEQLLNRCRDATLAVRTPILDVVREATELVPRLIVGLQAGDTAAAGFPEVQALSARADALRTEEPGVSAELYGIFRDDARERLKLVGNWLAGLRPDAAPVPVEAEIVRAFHTLRGSAAVARAAPVQRVAKAVEDYLTHLRRADTGLAADGQALLAEVVAAFGRWIGSTELAPAATRESPALQARVEQQQAALASVAATADTVPDRDAYTLSALEELQGIEAEVNGWPQASGAVHGAALAARFSDFGRQAAEHACPTLAEVARALAQRLAAVGSTPPPALLPALADIFEALYQRLDALRDGEREADAATLLDQVAGLPLVDVRAGRSPILPDESAPNAEVGAASPAPEAREELPATTPAVVSPAATSATTVDPELHAIFMEEAQELMAQVAAALAALSNTPEEASQWSGLQRVLHTLKGSARMAGEPTIGDAAERVERRAREVAEAPTAEAIQLLMADHAVLDSLLAAAAQPIASEVPASAAEPGSAWDESGPVEGADTAEAAEALEIPALVPVAEAAAAALPTEVPTTPELGAAEVQEAQIEGVASASRSALQLPEVPVPAPGPTPDLVPSEPERAAAEPSGPAPGTELATDTTGLDLELLAVFAPEAGELLETLDAALANWRDPAAANEARRALHTLKGGARVAGLTAMGDAVHALEGQVDAATAAEAHDAITQQALQAGADQLHGMYDALRRGDYSALVQGAAAPQAADSPWTGDLLWQPADERAEDKLVAREYARVPVDNLDQMLSQAGEVGTQRARLAEHNVEMRAQLRELARTVERVHTQLRLLQTETDAQIAARGLQPEGQRAPAADRYGPEFDPLEMDRYSHMQELSRTLAEAADDLAALHTSLDHNAVETDALLGQQGRTTATVQQGLMDALLVPFSRQQGRLERVVRQTAHQTGKSASLYVQGAETELDRNVLERIIGPLAHLVRNAVVHGIELPAARRAVHKPVEGRVDLRLHRQTGQVVVEVADDGRGLDFAAIRRKGIERGLLPAASQAGPDELARLILEPGFSTAQTLTQNAGRGVGLDVVDSAVRQLGGTLEVHARPGEALCFVLRLPLNMAVSQALLVRVGTELYTLPLAGVAGIARIPAQELEARIAEGGAPVNYGDVDYRVHYLGEFLGLPVPATKEERSLVAVLVQAGESVRGEARRVALVVDQLIGTQEILAKVAGPQLGAVDGIAGATTLPSGEIAVTLDIAGLVARHARAIAASGAAVVAAAGPGPATIMVVDDSITMRRIAQRLLERNGYRVVTARDGLDAMDQLRDETPAVVLLDIEMPRADGFEVAAFIRNDARLAHTPIIMITSRSGDKHRARAQRLGVERYLIKPYQEEQLLREIAALRQATEAVA